MNLHLFFLHLSSSIYLLPLLLMLPVVATMSTSTIPLFQCPLSSCTSDHLRCKCEKFTFFERFYAMHVPYSRELVIKCKGGLSDLSELERLEISIGNTFPLVVVKCDYEHSLADILRAVNVTSLEMLAIDSYITEQSLLEFEGLPFVVKSLQLQQQIKKLPETGIPPEGFSNGLIHVSIANTKITQVPNGFFRHLHGLRSVKIKENKKLYSLPNGTFINLTNLTELLFINNVNLTTLTNAHLQWLPKLSSLQLLDTFSGPLPSDLLMNNSLLQDLKIRRGNCGSRRGFNRTDCSTKFDADFFRNSLILRRFEYIGGKNSNTTFEPDSFRAAANSLRVLSLENVRLLPSGDLTIIQPLAHLKNLTLLSCGLKDVSLSHIPDSVEDIKLGKANSISCSKCDAVDALRELQSANRLKDADVMTLECGLGLSEAKKQFCSFSYFYYVVITAGLFCTTIAITVACLYWSRHRQRKGTVASDNDKPCEFDAFLSYAERDEDLACEIVTRLESDDYGLRCLVHSRDFSAGAFILDNIAEAVGNSRVTILIVSVSFLQSDWCRHEVTLADRAGGHVLVVMRTSEGHRPTDEELKKQPEIQAHVSAKTYLEESDPRFFGKLTKFISEDKKGRKKLFRKWQQLPGSRRASDGRGWCDQQELEIFEASTPQRS